MTAAEFARVMWMFWHEARTPLSVTHGYVRMLRREQGGPLSAEAGRMLASMDIALDDVSRVAGSLSGIWGHTVVGALNACTTFCPAIEITASDEARLVTAPAAAFAAHCLVLLHCLPPLDADAPAPTRVDFSVTPRHCRLAMRRAITPGLDTIRRRWPREHPDFCLTEAGETVGALEAAGCTVACSADPEHTIAVEWTRPGLGRSGAAAGAPTEV